jgi:pyrroline-5-carboxylate reductase
MRWGRFQKSAPLSRSIHGIFGKRSNPSIPTLLAIDYNRVKERKMRSGFGNTAKVGFSMRIGFIGSGRMAQALAGGIAEANPAVELVVFDPDMKARAAFSSAIPRAKFLTSNRQVCEQADLVFLAVKPSMVGHAFHGISLRQSQTIIISVVAGVSTKRLAELLETDQVIRVMPNTPALVRHGAIAMAHAPQILDSTRDVIQTILATVGTVVEVDELQLDAVTGLSGSGPAFVIEFIEALIDGGVKCGLPRDVAHTLAVQTVLGTAQMVKQFSGHPSALKDQVTSPGGTTIHGLHELNLRQFKGAVMAAVESAKNRATELGKVH